MGKKKSEVGNTYGKLTVINESNIRKDGRVHWNCICGCNRKIIVSGRNLRSGVTKTCGKCPHQLNTWEFKEDYVIGYTTKGDSFYIDVEDYERVSKYTWNKSHKYIRSGIDGKTVLLHRFVMGFLNNEDIMIDHKNNNENDNRKENLRHCNKSENAMNQLNVKGYYWNKKSEKYQAQIKIDQKTTCIGLYTTEEEARFAYCEKAIELFREFVHSDVLKDYERLSKKLNKINK